MEIFKNIGTLIKKKVANCSSRDNSFPLLSLKLFMSYYLSYSPKKRKPKKKKKTIYSSSKPKFCKD